MSIKTYRNKGTRDIALGLNTKEARKLIAYSLHQVVRQKLAFLAAAESLLDLKARSGLALHGLKGHRSGQYSIKINDQYRICFLWSGKDAELVEVIDYH